MCVLTRVCGVLGSVGRVEPNVNMWIQTATINQSHGSQWDASNERNDLHLQWGVSPCIHENEPWAVNTLHDHLIKQNQYMWAGIWLNIPSVTWFKLRVHRLLSAVSGDWDQWRRCYFYWDGSNQPQTNRAALHCLSALQPSITATEDVTVVHQIAARCSSLSVSVRRENMFLCSSVRYKAMLSYLRCSTVKFWQSGGYDRQKNKRNPSELIQLGDL